VQAILSVGKAMVISEEKIEAFRLKIFQEFRADGVSEAAFQNSVEYGQVVADHILAWALLDNYKQTRSLAKYAVSEEASTWKPTPPAYIKAIEPHWSKMRTFIMDSAQQFKAQPSTPFSTIKASSFYKEAKAVYDMGLKLTPVQREIANSGIATLIR
jgi:hypothetical protein